MMLFSMHRTLAQPLTAKMPEPQPFEQPAPEPQNTPENPLPPDQP